MKWRYSVFLWMIILCQMVFSEKQDWPLLSGPYLGQKPPGMTPEIFAPGIISTGFLEQFCYFTPDGKEVYWLLRGAPHTVVLCMKETDGRWGKPEVAPFSGRYFAKFCLSPDGRSIVLTSTKPVGGKGEPTNILTTWIVPRVNDGWGEPRLIPSLKDAAAPTISLKGNLFFYLDVDDERDIYLSAFKDGIYLDPVKLGSSINTSFDEVDPFISPDESYIIYGASGPAGDGLYISFRKPDGSWIKAINMSLNSKIPSDASCPSVTYDNKYLFFTCRNNQHKNYSTVPITYQKKIKILNSPGNGSADIFWMDATIIEEFRPQELR